MNVSEIDIPGPCGTLIADDEPMFRGVLETLMKDKGYSPTVAFDGQDAVDHVSSQAFEIALLDIGMPRAVWPGYSRHIA